MSLLRRSVMPPLRRQSRRLLLATWVLVWASTLVACGEAPSTASSERSGPPLTTVDAAAVPREPAAGSGATSAQAFRHDLEVDESRGGHTLSRHVGRSDQQLRQRLRRESLSAASTFTDRETAERIVFAALERDRDRITAWQRRSGPRPNLALRYRGSREHVIGRSVTVRANAAIACYDAVVVLRWDDERGDYYVLTAYPEAR